jgi:hypothetical protein
LNGAPVRPVHPSYIIAPTIYEIFKGDGGAFVS